MFTRHGGVSPQPWESLNLGGTVGDEREHVVENRLRIFKAMNRPVESIYDSWQVHGTHVICVDSPRPLEQAHEKGDAILTNRPDVTLFMRFADCVPILLFDPVKHVGGIVHAGWRGTLNKIAGIAVQRMQTVYGSRPQDILAGIGPSISVEHFEVGSEVVEAALEAFGAEADRFLKRYGASTHVDLWKANQFVLECSGVQKIETSGICTFDHVQDWYSHRAEHGKTGRYGAILAL
jgi:YfiH family protein